MLIFRFGLQKIGYPCSTLFSQILKKRKKNVAPSQTPGMSTAKGIEPQRQTYLAMSLAFLPGHQSAHLVLCPVDQIFISEDAEAPLC